MGSRRTSSNNLFSGILIVVLITLIFFMPSYGWRLRAWFGSSSVQSTGTQADGTSTISENEVLQSQLAQLQVLQSQLPVSSSVNDIRAMVYSRYPLSFKNQILVNVGSNDGITAGSGVIFQGILIGQVQKVFSHYAIVQTFFDNGVKVPIRIGTEAADGLLEGSSYPTIGSISKTAAIAIGDIVYSAAPGLPYGLPIGTVAATSTSADNLFQQATVNFSYDLNSIQTVFIVKQ